MYSENLLAKIHHAAQELSPTLLKDFEAGSDTLDDQSFFERFILSCPSSTQRQLLTDLLAIWQNLYDSNSAKELFHMLTAVSYSLHHSMDRRRPEIVWTGPSGKTPLRQTRQVLKELFSQAEREIFIVSYVVFEIPDLVIALAAALSRNVRLTCYFEDAEESGGKIYSNAADNLSQQIFTASETYVWNRDERAQDDRGNIGSLHAKVAIVDRRKIFLSSANLTKYALDLNVELGILFENQLLAEEILSHFQDLSQRKVFVRYGDNSLWKK